jgi:hypothetical protein
VDADHINRDTVDPFIQPSDFFTLDVAGYIGKSAASGDLDDAFKYLDKFTGKIDIPGIHQSFEVSGEYMKGFLSQYLLAIKEAGKLYNYLCERKGKDKLVAEVSMDEVEKPQSPLDLFFILALIAREGIGIQTIAPKFSGRFNKGIDYKGDIEGFRKEFEEDILVIKHATELFGLPGGLKLSIHSGSDKFSIYPVMGELIRKHDVGIHVKTAGTTWLEEIIGLSLGDRPSVRLVKEMYHEALHRMDELCGPYADVIDIDPARLTKGALIDKWTGAQIAASLRHIPENSSYNPGMRQLMHVAYKIAAEKGDEYINAVQRNIEVIGRQVEENIFERHIKRLFTF